MKHAERRQMTREALLASATAEICDVGISGASVRRIADRAGYTQGAFYSNFATLNALLEAALESQMRMRLDRMEAILLDAVSLDEVVERLSAWLRSMQEDTGPTLAMLEFQLHALRDAEFAPAYNRQRALQHDTMAHALETLSQKHGLSLKLPPAQLALGLSALWSGFALQGQIDHNAKADDLIGAFIGALI